MNSYHYLPLRREQEEIRLILLYPGEPDGQIDISIHHTLLTLPSDAQDSQNSRSILESGPECPWSLENTSEGEIFYLNNDTFETSWTCPQGDPSVDLQAMRSGLARYEPFYEALSYTWGTMDDPETVYVRDFNSNDKENIKTLEIGQSLATAFRHLRYLEKVRILWADAISINQQDVAERSTQVKRMADIYRLAYRVVAWIGMDSDDSNHALAALRYIGEQILLTEAGRLYSSPGAEVPNLWRSAYQLRYEDRTWKALFAFVERKWFYRLWCWQEIKLSSRHSLFQCGHDQIAWPVLRRAVLCLHNKEKLPSLMFRERCRHIAYLTADAIGHPMSTLLDLSRSKGCADPRDKIYGLLGLTAPTFSRSLNTDYSRTVANVYKDAFLAHLGVTRRLELLKHCVLSRRSINGPSWVPDWSKTDFAAPILSEQVCTGISSAETNYVAPGELEVTGTRFTTVQIVSSAASLDIEQALLALPDWLKLVPSEDFYVTGESMLEAFALTIFMNRCRERHPAQHFLSAGEIVRLLRNILALRPNALDDPIYSIREVGNCIQKVRGRVFFITMDGYMGMATDGVKAGRRMAP
jgi:hypothetical protein